MTVFFREVFKFVMAMSAKYSIDSTHDISHTFQVLNYAFKIYEQEQYTFPPLKNQEKVIYTAAALHDMCDRKYVNVDTGKDEINTFLEKNAIKPNEQKAIVDIIDTMSYSKVKKTGFPITKNINEHTTLFVKQIYFLRMILIDVCFIECNEIKVVTLMMHFVKQKICLHNVYSNIKQTGY